MACDLLVIGSGAAGLSAAVTAAHAGLKVIVAEKEPLLGGATARSGGGLWIPGHHFAREAGIVDTREAMETYIRFMTGPRYEPDCVSAFLDTGPEMVEFMERHTEVRFHFYPGYADYYPEAPGGIASGRTIFSAPFDGRRLGPLLQHLRPTLATSNFMGLQVGVDDLGQFMTAGRNVKSAWLVARRFMRYAVDWLRAGRTLRLTGGNALAAALLTTAVKNHVQLFAQAPAVALIERGGRVVGAEIELNGRPQQIAARCGVVLATGGFPHDSALRAQLFPPGATNENVWGVMPFGNSGDGIRLGRSLGAVLNDHVSSAVAFTPMMRLNLAEGQLATYAVFLNRGAPGILSVTPDGKRFVNEGRSYHEYGLALARASPDKLDPYAWMIADRRAIRRFGLGIALPFPLPIGKHLRAGHLKMGTTLADLARVTGIDADNLQATVARFNAAAASGKDPEFQRGEGIFDLAGVEPGHRPNPCLGPLDRPPFYAVKVFPGCVGTFAGLETNASAQVLRANRSIIDGLYAVGNDMASITGGDYIGGGCTIGPGMTFGYIAGRHAAAARKVSAGSVSVR